MMGSWQYRFPLWHMHVISMWWWSLWWRSRVRASRSARDLAPYDLIMLSAEYPTLLLAMCRREDRLSRALLQIEDEWQRFRAEARTAEIRGGS